MSPAGAQFIENELEFGLPIDSRRILPGFEDEIGVLFLTGRSETGSKQIALYPVRRESVDAAPMLEAFLPAEALFFDAGRVGSQLELLFLGPDGVSVLDPETGELKLILEMPSVFRTSSSAAITELDFLMDVNQDGREDIVLPDFDGLRIALQGDRGFEASVVLEIRPELRSDQGEPRYSVDPLHHYDFTLDGRKDLAIIRDNQFLVFERTEAGYSPQGQFLPIDIELEAEGNERFGNRVIDIDQSDLRLSRIYSVADLNGDELPDITTFTTISEGVFNKRTEYRVHLGRRNTTGVRYQSTADAEIPSDGYQVDLDLLDVDDSGEQDLVSKSFRVGFAEFISALFSRTVDLNVELYRMGTTPLYSAEPDYRASAKLRFSLSTGFINNPAVRFADFDGDGIADLLLQDGSERLEIRLGDGSDFGSRSLEWLTELPRDGSLIEVVDVNGDARQDVIIGYDRSDGEGMRNRVLVLVSHPTAQNQ